MGVIITTVLLAVAAGVLVWLSQAAKRSNDREFRNTARPLRLAAIVAVVVALTVVFFNSYTVVPPKAVAVVTEFGKPVDVADNGWTWHAPWADVTTFEGTIQSLTLAGDRGDDNQVTVRLTDDSTARLDVTLQWRINVEDEAGVKRLFGDYRDPARVDENFVERALRAALNEEFRKFNPVAAVKSAGAVTENPTDVARRAVDGPNGLKASIGSYGISVVSLTVSGIRYDDATERRLGDLRAVLAAQRVADEERLLNEKKSAANNALSQGARDQGTLYRNCLDMTERMLREGKALSAAWSCGAPPQIVVPVK